MAYTIFIDPLPRDFTSADLAALIRPFGEVVSAEIMCDTLGIHCDSAVPRCTVKQGRTMS